MKFLKTGSVRVSVNYGYDLHSLVLSKRTWGRIQGGAPVTIKGQGFHIEGKRSQDVWSFNSIERGSVTVTADDGFDVFAGTMAEVMTDES